MLIIMLLALALVVAGGVGGLRLSARTITPSPVPTPRELALLEATPTSLSPSPIPALAADAPTTTATALATVITDRRLGGGLLALVQDAATATTLFAQSSATATSPASTAKLATAAAVLSVKTPTSRITTTVLAGATPGSVVLAGAGDPTLTAATDQGAYPDAARISDLAAQLKKLNTPITQILIDGSLFSGPATSPLWDAQDVPSEYGAPITALMVDGGRDTPTAPIRSADPARAAGEALAAAVGANVSVAAGTAPAGAAVLATVQSAPISELVAQALSESDNVIAEMLARQVALAEHQPASFEGAATAVAQVLARQGVNIAGALHDGSGLARSDRLSPDQLNAILRLVSTGPAALRDVLAGLPVAAWDGTLATRFPAGSAGPAPGAGVVRAKTGTLTGVSALAGVVTDASGRLLVFALMADQVGPTLADTDNAEAALDVIAGALAQLRV